MYAAQDGRALSVEVTRPYAADHLGQDISRQFHGTLDGIGRKLGGSHWHRGVFSLKELFSQPISTWRSGQLKGDRGIGEGLGDIGEHLAGDNHLALFFDMRRGMR